MSELSTSVNSTTSEADRLVRKVLEGDLPSFAGLIRLYESEVWRITATLIRDWSATENLVQQVFIDAYTNLPKYQLGTDFGAWIRTLARNRVRKELRSLSRAEQKLAVYREKVMTELHSEEVCRDDSDLYLAALQSCRQQLPENEATLLGLRYERGWSFDAIAACRGMTAAAVQRAISRIRYRLRACIEGKLKFT
jgi:RNA polymerase sigma-70 factor (ECF subfamily)